MDQGVRRFVLVWHRRAGKEKTCLNLIIREMCRRVGVYYYFFPELKQGRKILWDGVDGHGMKFLDHFPKELIDGEPNNTDMKIKLVNGSVFQVVGTDNYDSVRGTNPVGIVMSEYSYQDPRAWTTFRPILAENKGWVIFNYTPNGENHGLILHTMAKKNPKWFCEVLTVDDTKRPDGTPVISPEDIQAERDAGMDEESIQREFYCSFKTSVIGAIYAKELTAAMKEKRVIRVPWEPTLPVHTFWDLGMDDTTAIWFMQSVGRERRFIDCYEKNAEGLSHYVKILREKPYIYGEHYAPHDIEVRELGTGKSRKQVAKEMGLEFIVVPKLPLDDGINAVRLVFPQCWFDEEKTAEGFNALKNYQREYDDKRKTYKKTPLHNWASNYSDAFRQFAVGFKPKVRVLPQAPYQVADPIGGY